MVRPEEREMEGISPEGRVHLAHLLSLQVHLVQVYITKSLPINREVEPKG